MTHPRRRRTVVIDDIELEVSKDGLHWASPEEEGLNPANIYELSKVVTHVQFYKSGKAGLWVDLTISNTSATHYLRVSSVDVGLENADPNTDAQKAPAGDGFKREISEETEFNPDDFPDYMWNERRYRTQLENSWTTMYDYYNEDDIQPSFHDTKGTHPLDRIFFHEAGSGPTKQHLVCDPVVFGSNSEVTDKQNRSRLHDLKTMVTGRKLCLLPTNIIEENCPNIHNEDGGECIDADHRNATSLWVLWEKVDVMRGHTQIDFNFEFGIDSQIGKIRNLYMYYILPEGGEFIQSKSSVEVFQPRQNHWMFGAWFSETGIDRTGPENRILRSKNTNCEFDADLGTYQIEKRKTANELLQKLIFTVVPALFGTFASALLTAELFMQNGSIQYSVPYILFGMLVFLSIILGYGIYVTILGKYTWASRGILFIAQKTDSTIQITKKKIREIVDVLRGSGTE